MLTVTFDFESVKDDPVTQLGILINFRINSYDYT